MSPDTLDAAARSAVHPPQPECRVMAEGMVTTRGRQVSEGSLIRWRAAYGLSPEQVADARAVSRKTKCTMDEACRMIARQVARTERRFAALNPTEQGTERG